MSIYVVKLSKWYLPNDDHFSLALGLVKSSRCMACYGKCRWKKALGYHSLIYAFTDIWCSEKCFNSGKIGRPDKRQRRAQKKLWKRLETFEAVVMYSTLPETTRAYLKPITEVNDLELIPNPQLGDDRRS